MAGHWVAGGRIATEILQQRPVIKSEFILEDLKGDQLAGTREESKTDCLTLLHFAWIG